MPERAVFTFRHQMGPCGVKDVRVTDAEIGEQLESAYREHGARLWRAVFAFAGDRQLADDAVAEAFAQALRRGGELRDPMAWIWRVAFRVAAGELKERRRYLDAPSDQAYETPEPAWEIMRGLARLSPMQRASIVLHHYGGYRAKDIAVILGSTSAAVRVHLSAGRRRLRSILEEGRDA
jgi:DNA-directed RNA polymerase specialized sigma24 family protein